MTSPNSGGVSSGNTSSTTANLSGNTYVPNTAVIPVQSTLGTALPISPGTGNEPSSYTNFSQYLPPGVYTNPQPGPQLSVNSAVPTAVGIVGQAVNYMNFVQTVLIPPDIQGAVPSINVATTTVGSPGKNAIQLVGVQGAPTGGSFTLTYGGNTTAAIPYNADVGLIQEALDSLASLSPQGFIPDVQTVTFNGGPTAGTFTLTLNGETTPAIAVGATGPVVQAALAALPTVAHQYTLGSVQEVQQVEVTGASGSDTFTLTVGNDTTVPLAWDSTNTVIQTALNDLRSVDSQGSIGSVGQTGTGTVTVTGGLNGIWTVTFNDPGPQPLIAADGSGLGGATVTVTRTQPGAPGDSPLTVTGQANGPWTVTFGATMRGSQGLITGDTAGVTANSGGTLGIVSAHTGYNGKFANAGISAVVVEHASPKDFGSTGITGSFGSHGSIGSVGVTDSGPWEIEFVGAQGNTPQPPLVANYENLTGGTNPSVEVIQVQSGHAPVDAAQTITVTATSGTFTLSWNGNATSPIAYNAPTTVVQAALQLPTLLGSGGASVSGSPGAYVVTFTGVNSGLPQSLIVATPASSTSPADTQTLSQQGINTPSIVVSNPNSGVTYTLGSDYAIVNVGGTNGTSTALYALQRVTNGQLSPGDYVQVAYNYTSPSYYAPYLFYSYSDVMAAYGPPFNLQTGTIQSGITLAAKFAFLNGASQVVCAAVQPTVASTVNGQTVYSADAGDYENALGMLADQSIIAVVCTDTGLQEVQVLVQNHVDQQSSSRFERRGIVGVDGTVSAVPASQRIIDAQELDDSRIMLVSPSTFNYFSLELNQPIILGGQYAAAALAGLTCSMSFAMPLTKKTIAGFSGVAELEQDGQMDLEAENGIAVIYRNRNNIIQCRHGLSTNPASLITREWSVIGQQDAMVYTLRAYLESDNLIGQPIYAYTLMNVMGSAEAALQSLIQNGLIADYTGLSVQQLATNPDVLEVSFNWLPTYPLNYIVCTFSISLTSGNVTTNTGTNANNENVTNSQQTAGALGSSTSVSGTPLSANSTLPTSTIGGASAAGVSNTVPTSQNTGA